ncbi:hypothetical protein [Modestobacter sp. NPDC049651]|uniref:hypothetical protein n=1 Tax=unclassified Modestobacter TaxID=2643866 RepID=UPI0033CF6089
MQDHSSCCGGAHDTRSAARRPTGEPPIAPGGPISQTIAANAARLRWRILSDVVEQRAQELHARSSYDCWNGLSERDQELWRHMARLDIGG